MHESSKAEPAGPTSPTRHGVLVLSSGMNSAGSGWFYNITNDMLRSAGHPDRLEIKERYGLGDILHGANCNVRSLDEERWERIRPALEDGHSFVVKSHLRPTPLVSRLLTAGDLHCTYIFRDPRDVVVSAYQRGKIRRANGYSDSFARLRTVDMAIAWMRVRQLPVYEAWREESGAMLFRYEDLKADGVASLRRLDDHLGLGLSDDELTTIADRYSSGGSSKRVETHFRGGGRRQDELTSGQLRRCNFLFRRSLASMGYLDGD